MEAKNEQIEEIRKEVEKMIENIRQNAESGDRVDRVERQVFASLIKLGLQLVRLYFSLLAQSPACREVSNRLLKRGWQSKGLFKGVYWSVFGKLELWRSRYFPNGGGGGECPLDEVAGLPEQCYSYVLEDWLDVAGAQTDYRQAAAQIERILGHSFAGMVAQRSVGRLSEEVEAYYEDRDWTALQEEGAVLCAGFDGKGVPIVSAEREGEPCSKAARLGKGQRRGTKKEATLSVSFSLERQVRTPEAVGASLFRPAQEAPPQPPQRGNWSQNRHVRAFLSDTRKAVEYGIGNLLERDPTGTKPLVFLMDGAPSLRKAVDECVRSKGLEERVAAKILDIIHLLEYVWDVANAVWGEKHPGREKWVEGQLMHLLESRSDEVLRSWNCFLEKRQLGENARKAIQKSITYLSNHQDMTDYKAYLAQGLPISTGIIESACGHLVKARMEQSGMRWGRTGAQSVMDVRAVYQNKDWEDFMEYAILKEQKRIYPESKHLILKRA